MNIKIEPMSQKNLKAVYDFELENRDFFEKILPPRPEKYFNYESFKELMDQIISEQLKGQCYMCIVTNDSGKMIGRVNLSSIRSNVIKKAELGYRISENEQAKGYASEAVRLIIEEASQKFGLEIIEAGTSIMNMGSQKVLLKNGFVQVREEKNVMKINGELVDGLIYEKYLLKD